MNRAELEHLDDQGMAAWDAHDAEAFANLFADEFVWHDWTLPEPIRDRAGVVQYFNAWITAIPDMQVKTITRVIGDDAVACEIEFIGTHTGPMAMGDDEIPATNRPVVGRGTYTAYARDGKIVEFRSHPDVAGVLMQIGLLPPS